MIPVAYGSFAIGMSASLTHNSSRTCSTNHTMLIPVAYGSFAILRLPMALSHSASRLQHSDFARGFVIWHVSQTYAIFNMDFSQNSLKDGL